MLPAHLLASALFRAPAVPPPAKPRWHANKTRSSPATPRSHTLRFQSETVAGVLLHVHELPSPAGDLIPLDNWRPCARPGPPPRPKDEQIARYAAHWPHSRW